MRLTIDHQVRNAGRIPSLLTFPFLLPVSFFGASLSLIVFCLVWSDDVFFSFLWHGLLTVGWPRNTLVLIGATLIFWIKWSGVIKIESWQIFHGPFSVDEEASFWVLFFCSWDVALKSIFPNHSRKDEPGQGVEKKMREMDDSMTK